VNPALPDDPSRYAEVVLQVVLRKVEHHLTFGGTPMKDLNVKQAARELRAMSRAMADDDYILAGFIREYAAAVEELGGRPSWRKLVECVFAAGIAAPLPHTRKTRPAIARRPRTRR
jgi:hypothetical protein